MFEQLEPVPVDPIMAVMAQCRADSRDTKIDLGPGIYRNDRGETPVMDAVKLAEQILLDTQTSKAYIGLVGNPLFLDYLRQLAFDASVGDTDRLTGIQTPGGCGALSLAAALIKASSADANVLFGTPTWANHTPIFKAAGLSIESHRYYDPSAKQVDFQSVTTALLSARPGDVALLHACCHNPTGADFSLQQWETIADICNKKGLIPLVDMAYQGFGQGLLEDSRGVSTIIRQVEEAMVTVSCSKNFGLYRERTGALFVLARNKKTADLTQARLGSLARQSYSMPPDHGAAVVATILGDPNLKGLWLDELTQMRERIQHTRQSLVTALGAHSRLGFLQDQWGMFSLLPLAHQHIDDLRQTHAVYMSGDGRINVAGLQSGDIDRLAALLNTLE